MCRGKDGGGAVGSGVERRGVVDLARKSVSLVEREEITSGRVPHVSLDWTKCLGVSSETRTVGEETPRVCRSHNEGIPTGSRGGPTEQDIKSRVTYEWRSFSRREW